MTRLNELHHRTHALDPARSPGAAGPGSETSGGGAQPVNEGCFSDGIETMLWNPSLNRARLRRLAARASVLSMPTLGVPAGIGIAVVLLRSGGTIVTGLLAVLSVLVAIASVANIVVHYRCFAEDHTHGPDKPCHLDRVPGEFFYRAKDFTDLPAPVACAAGGIIDAVGYIHANPAAAWLDHQHLSEIHQVAWNTLRCLDNTRTARRLVQDAREDAELADLVHTTRTALAAIDHGVLDVLTHLLHSVELTRAWASKLQHVSARTRLLAALDHLASIEHTVRAAVAVPQTTFAYVTAARDVLAAGPFAWEQAAPTPVNSRGPRSTHHGAQKAPTASTSPFTEDRDVA